MTATSMVARRESRERRLERLGYRDYSAYLTSKRWEETRAEYWGDPDTPKACSVCGTEELPLALHHRTYERVGAERLDDLTPVCPTCHALVHELDRRGDISGLDADLSALADPLRAAAYRRETDDRRKTQSEAAEDIERRRQLAAKVAYAEQQVRAAQRNLAKQRDRGRSPTLAEQHVARAEGRLERRLAKLRALEAKRPEPGAPTPSPENLRLQKAAENRIITDEKARAKAERERDLLGVSAAQRRIDRAAGHLAWLERNPTKTKPK